MSGQKVLIIDSDESCCALIKTALTTRGFSPTVAMTGRLGLQFFEEEKPGLVFVDFTLQDLDVRYLVREFRNADEAVGIILMSYPDQANLVQEALLLGSGDYLYKPLRSEEVYFKTKQSFEVRRFAISNSRVLKGIEERNLSLQKQNLLLARRIEESTKNLTRLYEDLKETYMRTIKALAHAIDARDHYTFSHSDNVTRYAEAIAKEMKVDPNYINDISDACQLHDLGKIGVHDNVLSKPSALTETEFGEIKLHAEKGAQILEPLKFLDHVIDIVKHHHERWDGKGYPDGLAGENIPLGARIMSVADSYDAMVSARPYRKIGLTKNEAVEEIRKNCGSQFDPKVVEAFLKVVDSFV